MKKRNRNFGEQYEHESEYLKDAIDYLHAQEDIMTIRISDPYHSGYPDIFMCVRGLFVVAELKDNIGVPSMPQKLFIRDIKKAGGVGAVCRTINDIERLLVEARERAERML